MTHARPRLVPCSAHLAGSEGPEGYRELGCGGQQVQTSLVSCKQLSKLRACGDDARPFSLAREAAACNSFCWKQSSQTVAACRGATFSTECSASAWARCCV